MDSNFETVTLVASPSYPNSIIWSEENLVAVASGRIITILNPSLLLGPRGLVKISKSSSLSFGGVEKEDLLAPRVMPVSLSHNASQPSARSISWSPPGLGPNAGCLLAVCSTDGSVKLYRPPFCEFSSEWVEVTDVTALLYGYFSSINFGEDAKYTDRVSCKMPKQTSAKTSKREMSLKRKITQVSENAREKQFTVFTDEVFFASSFGRSSSVEVLQDDGSERIWSRSIIECIEGGKALLLFPETTKDGEHGEWLDLSIELAEMSYASSLNGAMVSRDLLPPNIRPLMKLGNLPKQILRSDCCGVQKILTTGRAVEAWLNNSIHYLQLEGRSFDGF